MGDAQAVLEAVTVELAGYTARAYINGDALERLHCSSRTVFAVDDDHVVKVDYGSAYASQSWREWWFWEHHVKGKDQSEWLAATHGCCVDKIARPEDMGGGPYELLVSTTVQDRVQDSGGPLKRGRGRYAYNAAVKRVEDAFPAITDMYRYQHDTAKEQQFVYSEPLRHYVLVDYGMHVLNGVADAHMGACTANMQRGERIYAKSGEE